MATRALVRINLDDSQEAVKLRADGYPQHVIPMLERMLGRMDGMGADAADLASAFCALDNEALGDQFLPRSTWMQRHESQEGWFDYSYLLRRQNGAWIVAWAGGSKPVEVLPILMALEQVESGQ